MVTVGRDQELPVAVDQGENPRLDPPHEKTGGTSVEGELGFLVATSLLELPGAREMVGETPSSADMEQKFRFAGLAG